MRLETLLVVMAAGLLKIDGSAVVLIAMEGPRCLLDGCTPNGVRASWTLGLLYAPDQGLWKHVEYV